jgi:hypothetical protein
MVAPPNAPLALPPPAAAPAGLRAKLRGAAAVPVQPVEPGRTADDARFGASVRAVQASRTAESDGSYSGHGRGRSVHELIGQDLLSNPDGHPSGPFLAQQLGQSARLVVPTLVASAEVGAYAAAQQRAERAALGAEPGLDIHA